MRVKNRNTNVPSGFSSTRFLQSIASHTRVLVSTLKPTPSDHKLCLRRKISVKEPLSNTKNGQPPVRPARPYSYSSLIPIPLTDSQLAEYSRTSAASPNAGSRRASTKRRASTRKRDSGYCHLCEVPETDRHQRQILEEEKRTPLPEERRIQSAAQADAVTLPESHCRNSAPIPKPRPVTLPVPRRRLSRSAELRKALAEIDTNIIPELNRFTRPTSLSQNTSKRLSISLSFKTSTRHSAPIPPRRTSSLLEAEARTRTSSTGQSFFIDTDQPSQSPRTTRRFEPGTKYQPLILGFSPPAAPPAVPPKNPNRLAIHALKRSDSQIAYCHGPIPRRRSSLGFRMDLPRPRALICRLKLTLPTPPPARALSPFSSLSQQEGFYLQRITDIAQKDPIWTLLMQASTVEQSIREICLKAGQVYLDRPELTKWIDAKTRNIDCRNATTILTRYLSRGGKQMERMAAFLLDRLVSALENGIEISVDKCRVM